MAYSLQNVIKGSLIYSGARVLTSASSFLLIPLYTRFLTPVDYGIIGYLDVVFRLLGTLLMFGFYGAQTRLYYDYGQDKEKIGGLLFNLNFFLIITLLIFYATVFFFGQYIYNKSGSTSIPFLPYFPIKAWALFFQILNQMAIVYYMTIREYKICALIQLFQFLAITIAVIIFVVGLNQGALGRFKGVLIGQAICFLICYPQYFKLFKFRISPNVIKFALVFGLPIVVHLLSSVLFESIDRIMLEKYVSIGELGIYTLGYQIGFGVNILIVSLNRAWTPNFYELMNHNPSQRNEKVRQVYYALIILVGALCIVGSIYTDEYLPIFVTPKYYKAADIIPIILFSYFFHGSYFFGVQPIFYYKKTKFLPFITGSAAGINIILNYLLIPGYGIIGAAYATAVSHVYLSILVHIIGRHYYNPNYNYQKIIIISVYLFVTCCLIKFDAINIKNELYKISLVLIYGFICYKLFGNYFKMLRGKLPRAPLQYLKRSDYTNKIRKWKT